MASSKVRVNIIYPEDLLDELKKLEFMIVVLTVVYIVMQITINKKHKMYTNGTRNNQYS